MTEVIKLSSNRSERTIKADAALAVVLEGLIPLDLPHCYYTDANGIGYLEVRVFNQRIHVGGIGVRRDHRGHGKGTELLQRIISAADTHGAEIELTPDPFPRHDPFPRMGKRELAAWYRRHGFKKEPNRDRMIRMPVAVSTQQAA